MTTVVSSLDTPNMMDYALFLQDTAGASSLAYSIDDLRLLNSISVPGAGGVKDATNFLTTVSGISAGYVRVAAGTGVTQYNGEYYAFRSNGNVDIPVYTNGHAFNVTHTLCAQVFDHQLSYTTVAPSWGYVLAEDTSGSGAALPSNAIPICGVTVTPGQTSGYVLTDLRYPYQHAMTCSISGALTGTSFAGSTNTTLTFNTEVDDEWNMFSSTASNKLFIKQPGIYNVHFHLSVPSVDSTLASPAGTWSTDKLRVARAYVNKTDNSGTVNIAADFRPATDGGATCHAIATAKKIIPSGSTYLQVVAYQSGPAAACTYDLTVQRVEYRSS